jgi:tight adherence protein C
MDWLVWLIRSATFVTAAFFTYGLLLYYHNRKLVRERFAKSPDSPLPLLRRKVRESSLKKRFLEWISSFGKWGMKDQGEESKARNMLIQAGYRHPKSLSIYFGVRVLTAFFLPLPFLLTHLMKGQVGQSTLLFSFMVAGVGFYLPHYLLKVITRRRQDRLDKALPDVLDLFIVCMEAGLGLQATINRVTEEIKPVSKDLYQELQLTNAELRTGIPREVALKNLGERTGVQSIKSLVSLMIQSDRMGASIAQALRTHASFLRVQRGQKAEEIAAKLPVKILFPMVLFILPSIFIVVMGPAVIQMSKSTYMFN